LRFPSWCDDDDDVDVCVDGSLGVYDDENALKNDVAYASSYPAFWHHLLQPLHQAQ
jgi:hypothetical protein